MLANVVDAQGFPIAGFEAKHFMGTFRGQPVKIVSAQWESTPRRIVVMLDASASMLGGSKWDLARRAAGDLISLIPAENSVAFLTFGDQVYDKVAFSQNPKQALDKIAALQDPRKTHAKVGGRTALFDALSKTLAMFGTPRSGDVIYLITDGGANAGKTKQNEVERALLASGTRLFVFTLFEPLRPVTPEELDAPPLMRDLTKLTGGNLIAVLIQPLGRVTLYDSSGRTYATLATQVRTQYQQMTGFYQVEIELPQNVDKPREWKLNLVGGGQFRPRDFELTYPRKLLPCAAAGTK